MIRIGDFSKLSQISIRMLRHYDEIGLLKPQMIDKFTSYRYYKVAQLTDASRITMLKNMGFSLSVIEEILKQYSNTDELMNYLKVKEAEAEQEAAHAAERLNIIRTAINRLGKDANAMKYEVNIKTIPERYIASLRRIIPSYDKEWLIWEQIRKETEAHGMALEAANPSYGLAVFHDKGFKDGDVDVEIQIAVEGKYENTENVVFRTVPETEVASTVYTGSYEYITEAYAAVAQWVTDNGYDFDGAMFCIYHVSPAQEKNPDKYVTEVCFPVKKA